MVYSDESLSFKRRTICTTYGVGSSDIRIMEMIITKPCGVMDEDVSPSSLVGVLTPCGLVASGASPIVSSSSESVFPFGMEYVFALEFAGLE